MPSFLDRRVFFSGRMTRIVPLFILGVGLSGCGVSGSGDLIEKELEFEAYDSIVLAKGFEGRVVMGDEFSVRITADDNLMEYVRAEVRDGQVTVELERNSYRNATLEAEFTLPRLARAKVEDGTFLYAPNAVTEDTLELIARDGSQLIVSLKGDTVLSGLNLVAADGASIEFEGQSEETAVDLRDGASATLSGEGGVALSATIRDGAALFARKYEVEEFFCSIRDGASAEVYASEEASGSLTDGASLVVWGEPHADLLTSDGSSVEYK